MSPQPLKARGRSRQGTVTTGLEGKRPKPAGHTSPGTSWRESNAGPQHQQSPGRGRPVQLKTICSTECNASGGLRLKLLTHRSAKRHFVRTVKSVTLLGIPVSLPPEKVPQFLLRQIHHAWIESKNTWFVYQALAKVVSHSDYLSHLGSSTYPPEEHDESLCSFLADRSMGSTSFLQNMCLVSRLCRECPTF